MRSLLPLLVAEAISIMAPMQLTRPFPFEISLIVSAHS
jgi:hypothetical protein